MKLSVGIVGLPNVGKSTMFNAITKSGVDAENYPFCTIEPNSGVVPLPDERLDRLAKISNTQKTIYATIEFVDIAGLVKGASKGEGLGNQFLANIRETSVIAHVVRCFDDPNVIHVEGKVDPLADIETINAELLLADFEMAERAAESQQRRAKSQDKEEKAKLAYLEKARDHLASSKPLRSLELSDEDKSVMKQYHFLTAKKTIYVANVSEDDIATGNDYVKQVQDYAAQSGDSVITVCAHLESELSQLDDTERQEYLDEIGLKESGLDLLAKAGFKLLGLQTYLTTGEKETRAWTIRKGDTAPKAAGVIHTDFEKGFIRANVISYDDFVDCDGWKVAKDKGLVRQEGKEYIMQDGDIVEFLFNT